MKKITIVDMYGDGAPEGDVLSVVGAIQRQVSEDFAPIWGTDARLRVVKLPDPAADKDAAEALRHSDGIIYISPEAGHGPRGVTRALAYHFESQAGIPSGYVFPEIACGIGQSWSVAASHETLEMLVDPDLNQLVGAPHPTDRGKRVLRPREVCDPVQAHSYVIDGVRVTDFVTPEYFATARRHPSGRQPTHYLHRPALAPFQLLDGGYFAYLDLDGMAWRRFPDLGRHDGAHPTAQRWADVRRAAGLASRRYRRLRVGFDGVSPGGRWPDADPSWGWPEGGDDDDGGSNG